LVNLPDFTRLVEQAGPAVVNIEAKLGGKGEKTADRSPMQEPDSDDPMQEFFHRFFGRPGGPGAPMPEDPRRGTSFGTGFVISGDGYVLTNHHVVEDASEIIVHLSDRRELTAKVVGTDPSSDIALLKVEATSLPVLAIGDSRTLKPGQWVLAIGSPFGFDHSVTAGVVSGLGRPSIDGSQRYVPFIQTDVAINRGNSGGPLLNTRGEVVGVNSQIFSNSGGYMGVSFAIPIEVAMNAVQQLKTSGKVSRGQLGVRIGDVKREDLADLGLTQAGGAFVASVENDSAAEKAGIRPGDVIVAFNGKEIGNSSELPPMVGALPPGTRVTLKVLRDGKSMDVSATLAKLDESVAGNSESAPRAPAASATNDLGIAVTELDAATRAKLGLAAGEGVRIARVDDQAARTAGLAVGDVVLQVGKSQIGSVAQFEAACKGLKSGDRVRLLIRNSESTGLITVTVS
jgi:serine protease Do